MFIIFGLIIMAGGVLIVYKADRILYAFGPIAFFDKYLGTEGGSRLGYKLIGVLVIILGMLVFTNMMGDVIMWFVNLLTPNSRVI